MSMQSKAKTPADARDDVVGYIEMLRSDQLALIQRGYYKPVEKAQRLAVTTAYERLIDDLKSIEFI